MLIIPFDRRIDWSHPPVVTLSLILVNVLVFVVWQAGDDRRLDQALTYYGESGLAEMERSAYEDYLTTHREPLPQVYQETDESGRQTSVTDAWTEWALTDPQLATLVAQERLIPPGSEAYPKWRSMHEQFAQLMSRVVFWEYGLKTDRFDPVEMLTHMFLHGDLMHLLGNMFFLMAVGFLVERTFGSGAFLACYLLAGLGSAAFDLALAAGRVTPGIGASGAISGLMGMYAVLFWTRRIRFFYFFFVVFGFASLPAIILLPVWMASELFQLLTNTESNINYLAHLGGLISGGSIALAVRRYLPSFSLDAYEQEDRDKAYEQQVEQAVDLCRALEYRKAQPILARLLAQRPDDEQVLYHLHQCSRLDPRSEEYHRLTRRILSIPHRDRDTERWVLDTYRDYLQRAKPSPRLDRDLVIHLAGRFIERGHLDEAERLVTRLLKKAGGSEPIRQLASTLGRKMVQAGNVERGRRLLAYLERLGP